MRRPILLFFVLLFGLSISSALAPDPSHAANFRQASDAPYLMAFSNDPAPHFIIERADGTDSRVFANDVMPPETNYVDGAGWSPSGEWFAWTANVRYDDSNSPSILYIMSADGQTTRGLDNFVDFQIRWSPNADLLLMVGKAWQAVEPHYLIAIFDPHKADGYLTDEFLAGLPPIFYVDEGQITLHWTTDGGHGIVAIERGTQTIFYELSTDGIATEWYFETADLLTQPSTIFVETVEPRPILISALGEVAEVTTEGSLTLHNLATGDTTEIVLPDAQPITQLWWSDDGQQALLLTTHECEELGCPQNGLWLYARAGNRITEVFPLERPLGSILPAPDFRGVFFTRVSDRGAYTRYYDIATATLSSFDYWLSPDVPSPVAWNETGWLIFMPRLQQDTYAAFVFDTTSPDGIPNDGIPDEVGQLISDELTSLPILAPNGERAILVTDKATVWEVASGQAVALSPDSRRFLPMATGSAIWHPAADYALLFEHGSVPEEIVQQVGAENVGVISWTGVVNGAGKFRRAIGSCYQQTPLCIHWLPPQVDALATGHNNRPVQPVITIPVGVWLDELVWSPDGTQIASGEFLRWVGQTVPFDVWAVGTGEKVAHFAEVFWDETIAWQGDPLIPEIILRDTEMPFSFHRILATSPDGTLTARVSLNDWFVGPLKLTDANDEILYQDEGLSNHASASFSPDGRYLVYGSLHSPVRILDLATMAIVASLPTTHSSAIRFSPDGAQLAVAAGTVIQIFNVEDLLAERE